MHFHCEIVIPPTDDIEAAVTEVMAQFDENKDGKNTFWDYWTIGGRWAGEKEQAGYDPARIEEFYRWCKDEGVTVSGLQWGKQQLEPAYQIPKVDAKWNEMFRPGSTAACPLFNHSNRNDGPLSGDVCRLDEVPEALKASRVIFAKRSYDDATRSYTGPLKAEFMLCQDIWNGCNYMKVDWDCTFASALAQCRKSYEPCSDEFRAEHEPKADWLVVTVDCHS